MVSDSQKTIAVIIVIAMAFAATTPLIVGGRADGMSLRARDIGPWWQENERFSYDYTGNKTYGSLIESVVMSNETCIIVSQLFIFNSSEAIADYFPGLFLDPKDVDIGDGGLVFGGHGTGIFVGAIDGQTFYANGPNTIVLEFLKGNVVSIIILAVKGIDTPAQSWINDFILDVGFVQLQKIERYSSS
jgi:hypothetical protein